MKPSSIVAFALCAGLCAQRLSADDQPGTAPSSPEKSTPTAPHDSSPKKKKASAPQKSSGDTEPLKATPLTLGPAIVTQKGVNVRAQAAINSEVVVRLKKGDHVNVIEEVTLKKPKTDEPAKWAKVSLPTNATAWVNASFINAADKTVAPKKLKVRSGPGENYSVLAIISKGTAVKELETKGDWMKIEAPADACGYIASHLLSSEPASPAPPPLVVATVEPPKAPPIVETKVAPPITPAVPAEPVVPPTTPPAPVTPPNTVVTPTPPADPPPATPPAVVTPAEPASPAAPEESVVKRVISREGVVKRSVSIQAPTYFALESLDTGKTINYLFSPGTNLVLKDFRGKRIVVTGEEMLDERWPNTPVINVENLQEVP